MRAAWHGMSVGGLARMDHAYLNKCCGMSKPWLDGWMEERVFCFCFAFAVCAWTCASAISLDPIAIES